MDGHIRKRGRDCFHLRRKGKPYKSRGKENKQGKFVIEHTIHKRPTAANNREELGHLESDTVLGKKGGARLVTHVDRVSRYALAGKTPDGTAENV